MSISSKALVCTALIALCFACSLALGPPRRPNAPVQPTKLTATLVAWISSQSEGIVEEMEAIAKYNSESSLFSVVNYLRYLNLYDELKVVASKPIEELKWVQRKAKVFSRIYKSAMEIVRNYLHDVDTQLQKIEHAEPKGKQVSVSPAWVQNYEMIQYIATHAPRGSDLSREATEMLSFSPNNSSDKQRSTRYRLKTIAFNRR